MYTLRYGQKMKLVLNAQAPTSDKRKEVANYQGIEFYEMPPVILATGNETEEQVEHWYRNHVPARNVILEYARRHPNGTVAKVARELNINAYPETFPAPPCILAEEEA